MKRRARRVTIGAAILGAGVVAVLVWGTVCDHAEAWRFQLTRKTQTAVPGLDRERVGRDRVFNPVNISCCSRQQPTLAGSGADMPPLMAEGR